MDAKIWEILGQVAGIGGIALGVVLYVFRGIIKKNIFPMLTKDQAYKIIRLMIVLAFIIGVLGIFAWVYSISLETNSGKLDKRIEHINSQIEDNFIVYSIPQFHDSELFMAIESIENRLKHENNSETNIISFSSSGTIEDLEQNNLCYYTGGHLTILIDGNLCCEFSNLRIEPTLKAGNPCHDVRNYVVEKTNTLIKVNRDKIAKGIAECLK